MVCLYQNQDGSLIDWFIYKAFTELSSSFLATSKTFSETLGVHTRLVILQLSLYLLYHFLLHFFPPTNFLLISFNMQSVGSLTERKERKGAHPVSPSKRNRTTLKNGPIYKLVMAASQLTFFHQNGVTT